MSNMVRYGGFSVETLDKVADQASSIAGNNFMDLEVGENVVRFIPPTLGVESRFRVTAMHYIDGIPGVDKMRVFACPRVELKQPCLACAESERLNKTGSKEDKDRAYRISAGLRVYANVINRKNGRNMVLAFGKTIFDQLKAIRRNPRLGGDFTDPSANGFDIVINREGAGRTDTKYMVSASREATPLAPSEAEVMEIIENQIDLEALVDPTIPEEIQQMWGEVALRRPAYPSVQGRVTSSVPATSAGPRVGSALLPQRSVTAQAAQAATAEPQRSALQPGVELDDDFNPIVRK
jgi:hypothetical protein